MVYCSEPSSGLETPLKNISLSSHHASSDSGRSDSINAQHDSINIKDTIDQNLLSQQSWIRSAGQSHYRLKGLYMTCKNFETVFQSFNEESEARIFAGQILHALSLAPLLLSGEDALQALEENWTGNTRPRMHSSTSSSPIFAQFRVSYYVSARWEVVKELSYLAVSQNLLDSLFTFAIVSKSLNSLSLRHAIVGTSNIPVLCERLLQRSVQEDLNSAIREHTFSVRMDPIIGIAVL